jgi:molecular chaperone DnaK
MAVIGIDLGTTYSAAARCVGGMPEVINLEGRSTLPSVVGVQKSGKIAIGWTAKRNQARFPTNTIVEVKRKMGGVDTVKLGDKQYSAQEVSAMILSQIKKLAEAELGEPVTGAVISCPAYFMDPARAATKEAAELAGLKVLKIVNEPTAAAYAYGVRQGSDDKEKLFVVYDLGGGTFDVTVIRMVSGELEVIGTGGDPQLGGGNFDDRIVEWILAHVQAKHPEYAATLTDEKRNALRMRLKFYAEEGKIALCNMQGEDAAHQFQIANVDSFQNKPIVFNEVLTRAKFEELIRDLLENSLKWIDEALNIPKEKHNYAEDNITAVLLVGGSTRIPYVRKVLEKRFPKTEIWGQDRGINPDEIVAMGASLVAADADITGDEAGPGSVLVDVTGHTLSVAVFDDRRQREILAPIVAKETAIPCAAQHRFLSSGKRTDRCLVRVYQGEGIEIDPQRTAMIGQFFIEIPPIDQQTPIMVGLDLDANGILVAHATDMNTGQKVSCKIDYSDTAKIRPEELEQRKAQLQAQLNAVINQSANPLADDAAAPQGAPAAPRPAAAAAAGGAAFTVPPPAPMPAPAPMPEPAAAADPTAMMNPILRMLYSKALNSFMNVPADRQGPLVQLVTEIEAAARAGDRQKLDGYLPQLTKLLDGVN